MVYIKAKDDKYKSQYAEPVPVASLRYEPTHTTIYVFKKINWFHRFMLNLCFGLKYSKI